MARLPARTPFPEPAVVTSRSLLGEAGVEAIEHAKLAIEVEHQTFEEWWQPFELGVGPAGSYVSALGQPARVRLAERCRELLPEPPFVVTAAAWVASGRVTAAMSSAIYRRLVVATHHQIRGDVRCAHLRITRSEPA